MAKTTKTAPKKSKPKPRALSSADSVSKLKQIIAAQAREIREGQEQQAATGEILRMIARAPADFQSVMDTIAESAARLCDAKDALIFRVEGDVQQRVAVYGAMPTTAIGIRGITRGTPVGRAIVDRETIHVHDIAAEIETEFPKYGTVQKTTGIRTALATPLMRDGVPLGVINIRRTEVRPFTDKQIKLLETFADQAVIAIENARLVQEQQSRNRELTDALEQQTATSEILRVIASSPTDLQPVLNVVVENTARLCDSTDAQLRLVDGSVLRLAASYGPLPVPEMIPVSRHTVSGRAVTDRQVIHVHDLEPERETEYPEGARDGSRTILGMPLFRDGIPIGAILIRRLQVRPFTDKQITLLKTFADQAVIAIENVRLFKELQERNRDLTEALEQQTATGEVLRVIASSPTEIQPVLDTLLANAVKLSGATKGHVRQVDGEFYRVVAHYGETGDRVSFLRANPLPASPDTPLGRALVKRSPVHILDVQSEAGPHTSLARQTGARTMLATPLLREGTPIGGIIIWREFVEPFTERQIEFVKTFADQAVIAIENVRLFQELKESLEQQTATSQILGVIASSPTDIQPVLDVVAENAARLCDSNDAQIFRVEGDMVRKVASYGVTSPVLAVGETRPIRRGSPSGRAILDREPVHIHNIGIEREEDHRDVWLTHRSLGIGTALAVPLLREGVAVGAITIRRTEVRPFIDKQIAMLKTFARSEERRCRERV